MPDFSDFGHLCPMPFDRGFYRDLLAGQDEWEVESQQRYDQAEGRVVELKAGQILKVKLLEGPQIVHLFPFNSEDPDERYYAHHTILIESLYLTRYSRMFSTMARFRPLMTILADTVATVRNPDRSPVGRHHPAFGGWGTPANWQFSGGKPGVATAWDQLVEAIEQTGNDRSLIKDELCLFQKCVIDRNGRRLRRLRSDAMAGDYVTLFAEIDLTVLLALSPYRDGGSPASEMGDGTPRAVELTVYEKAAEPLAWPYPGEPYPDISGYLDQEGHRSVELSQVGEGAGQ